MNTKGIKFLAVLAVLAMAFAAFAVVETEDSDAAAVTESIAATALTTTGTDMSGATNYVAIAGTADAPVKVNAASGTSGKIYLLKGTSIEITSKTGGVDVTVIVASAITGSTSPYSITYDASYTYKVDGDNNGKKITITADADGTGMSATADAELMLAAGTPSFKGIMTNVGSEYKYYSGSEKQTFTVDGTDVTAGTVKIVKGSIDISATYDDGTKKTTELSFADMVASESKPIIITMVADAKPTVNGTDDENNAGTITVKSGLAAVLNTFEVNDISFNCVADAVIGTGNPTIITSSVTADDNDDYMYAHGNVNLTLLGTFGTLNNMVLTDVTGTVKLIESTKTTTPVVLNVVGVSGTLSITAATPTFAITAGFTAGNVEITAGTITQTAAVALATGNFTVGAGATFTSTNSFTLTAGNLVVASSGSFKAAATSITGELSIAANGSFEATGALTQNGAATIRGTMTLGAASTTTGGDFMLFGTLTSAGTPNLTVNPTASKSVKFTAASGSTIYKVNIIKGADVVSGGKTYTATLDLTGATDTVYLKGTVTETAEYGQTQEIIVDGDLEIKNKAELTIKGKFVVQEGFTVTVTSGKIIINSDTAVVDISGSIVIVDDTTAPAVNELNFTKDKESKISGTITSNGNFNVGNNSHVTIADGAKVIIGADSNSATINGLTVAKGGLLQVNGKAYLQSVTNKGTVKLDNAILTNNALILQAGDGAVVEAVKFVTDAAAARTLTVEDTGFKATKDYTLKNDNIVVLTTKNVAENGISGLTFTEKSTLKTENDVKNQYLDLIVSGSIAAVGENATATIQVNHGAKTDNVVFADGFSVGAGVTFLINEGANLEISNSMEFKGSTTTKTVLTKTGTLVVSGKMSWTDGTMTLANDDNVSALKFTIGSGTTAVVYYASVEDAVEVIGSQSEDVTATVLGNGLIVADNVEIPANMKLTGTGAFAVGTNENTDVVVTVANGSSVSAGVIINVNGTFVAENSKDLKNIANIAASVKTTSGNSVKFTNIYSALSSAQADDVVEATSNILITKSVTIPAGVTFNVPVGLTAQVDPTNKVTITVNGTLQTNGMTLTAGHWGTEVSATVAVLKINGTFMTSESNSEATVYANYEQSIDGVYYYLSNTVGSYVYIQSLKDALASGDTEYHVYGKVSESSSVEATSSTGAVTITVENDSILNVSDLTLKKAKINTANAIAGPPAKAAGLITGTIKGVVGGEIGGTPGVIKVTKFVGEIDDQYSEAKGYALVLKNIYGTVTVDSGVVTADDINEDDSATFAVSAGATFVIPDGKTVVLDSKATIAGTVNVYGVLTLSKKDISVSGAIAVIDDVEEDTHGTLNVNAQIKLTGTIAIDEKSAANVTGNVIVGTEPTKVGAAAGISGKLTIGADAVILVYPGADVSAMIIDADGEGASTAKTTTFVLDDSVYMVAYVKDGSNVTYATVVAIPDYKLEGYTTDDLKVAATWGLTADGTVGSKIAGEAEIEADLIPTKVSIGAGIQMYIDGIRVNNDVAYNLSVGSHTVTANVLPGYKGSIAITVNGTAVQGGAQFNVTSDMKQVIVSATGDITVDAGDTPAPTPEEKSEWTITTILMVVLVILIAVMVIVMVLKMNRS